MKAVVAAFNQKKALLGTFSVIVITWIICSSTDDGDWVLPVEGLAGGRLRGRHARAQAAAWVEAGLLQVGVLHTAARHLRRKIFEHIEKYLHTKVPVLNTGELWKVSTKLRGDFHNILLVESTNQAS